MRLTFGLLLLILLMYLGGTTVVADRSRPILRTWHGEGNAQTIHFEMPSGPLPWVIVKRWKLSYHLSCAGLTEQHPTGAPSNIYVKPTFSFTLVGNQTLDDNMETGMSNYARSGAGSMPIGNGGRFTLSITARPTCAWTVTAASVGIA